MNPTLDDIFKNPQASGAPSLDQIFKAQTVAPSMGTVPPPSPSSGFSWKGLGNALIKSERNFGESLAGSAQALGLPGTGAKQFEQAQEEMQAGNQKFIDIVARRLKTKREAGEDVSKEIQQLKNAGAFVGLDAADFNPALNKTTKQILGEALGVATDIASFGTYGSGFKSFSMASKALPTVAGQVGTKAATTFTQGAIKGAARGAASGAVFGGAQGVSRGMQDNLNTEGIIGQGVVGSAFGGVLGGVLGGITGGISGALKGRQLRKQELNELIASGDLSNKKLAQYDVNTLQKDKVATEAIRQGVDERSVAAIKTMSATDKAKAVKMLNIAEKASQNKRVVERPLDVAGESILAPAKKLSETLKSAGRELDGVASSLKGQAVNNSDDIVRSINDDMLGIGASVDDAGVNFRGSTLEGVGSNEKIINNVYRRIAGAKDAFDLHKVKRYIDNNVSYGKSSEGLAGEAERILKDWRRLIDSSLDTQFTDYNRVNTVLSETINQLDDLNSIMGRSFNVNQPLAEIKAGQVASRLLGNGANRGDILRVLDNLQATAKKYGYESTDDIVNQVIFADTLEDLFGTQAPRSLQGQTQRAIEQATGVGKEFAQGNYLKGATQAVVQGYKTLTGVTPETKMKALRALLEQADDVSFKGGGIPTKLVGATDDMLDDAISKFVARPEKLPLFRGQEDKIIKRILPAGSKIYALGQGEIESAMGKGFLKEDDLWASLIEQGYDAIVGVDSMSPGIIDVIIPKKGGGFEHFTPSIDWAQKFLKR